MDFDELTVPRGHGSPRPPADDVPAKLVVLEGRLRGTVVDIRGGALRIGRQDDNDLVLASDGVSRRHARILAEDGRFLFEDLMSSNGSLCNDRSVPPGTPQPLKHQDTITICEHRMLFLERGGRIGGLDLATIQLDRSRIDEEAEEALRDFLAPSSDPG